MDAFTALVREDSLYEGAFEGNASRDTFIIKAANNSWSNVSSC